MVVFWVIGLYVLTRSRRNWSSRLAALGQFLAALYLLGHALSSSATTPELYRFWGQRFWIGAALSPVVWYWLVASIADRSVPQIRHTRSLGLALSLLAMVTLIAGYVGDWLFRWSTP